MQCQIEAFWLLVKVCQNFNFISSRFLFRAFLPSWLILKVQPSYLQCFNSTAKCTEVWGSTSCSSCFPDVAEDGSHHVSFVKIRLFFAEGHVLQFHASYVYTYLVGGSNPSEKYESNWIISPGNG